jgi:hypothetical protein
LHSTLAADTEEPEAQPSPPSGPAPSDITGPVLGFSADDDVSDDDEGSPESSDEPDAASDAEERRRSSAGASTSATEGKESRELPNEGVKAGVKGGGETWPAKGRYDAKSREPSFCNAETACWWELTALAAHAHPSVMAMAKTLLAGANVVRCFKLSLFCASSLFFFWHLCNAYMCAGWKLIVFGSGRTTIGDGRKFGRGRGGYLGLQFRLCPSGCWSSSWSCSLLGLFEEMVLG